MLSRTEGIVLLVLGAIALVASGIGPDDRMTWLLEVFPIFIAVPILLVTRHRFPLTPLVYRLIFVHALILMLGGHYTYAKVPLGFWIQDWFDFARNHYDRIGHFAQGFVPAMVAREILLRCSPLERGNWLFFIVVAFVSPSARATSSSSGGPRCSAAAADAFLGTQGDVWDTQWDMFLATSARSSRRLRLAECTTDSSHTCLTARGTRCPGLGGPAPVAPNADRRASA